MQASCLKCGGEAEEGALLCDHCAEASLQEPRFFLNPVLVGPSIFSKLRERGSATCLLGPASGSDIVLVHSADLVEEIKDMDVQLIRHEDLKDFYRKCNEVLAHLGVPLKLDSPRLLLTEDAAEAITTIVQKVNAAEKMFPGEGMSDLYIRLGVIYWSASQGILLRTTSKRWRESRRAYLVSRAKEFFSKVPPEDELFSIAARSMGLMCLDAEEWTEAEEHLSVALKHFPDDPRIGEGIARAHLMLGNQMEALSRVDEVISRKETPSLWVLKGKILRDLDRDKEALECFSRAISLDSRYLPAHDIMIETLRDMGRLEEAALAESQRALARRPDLEQKIAELLGEFRRAAEEVRVAEAKPGAEVRRETKPAAEPVPRLDPLDAAKKALASGDYDSAIQLASDILKERPENRAATLVVIESLLLKGDLKSVAPKIHAFYEQNREDPVAWYWRGMLASKENKWGAAVQYLSKAVSLNPRYLDAWILMGEVLLDHGKTAAADESFSKALEIDPECPRAWLGKAGTMRAMGRWGAAIQSLDKYTSLVPSDKDAWKAKADLLFEKEKYKRAIEAYDRYLELVGDDSYALGRKGIALNAIGLVGEARKCLEESVRLDPENKEAAKWLRTLKGGET